jgi:hypothetical protein
MGGSLLRAKSMARSFNPVTAVGEPLLPVAAAGFPQEATPSVGGAQQQPEEEQAQEA